MRRRHADQGEEGMRLGLRHAGMPRGTAAHLCLCLSVQLPCCAGAEDAVHAGIPSSGAVCSVSRTTWTYGRSLIMAQQGKSEDERSAIGYVRVSHPDQVCASDRHA